MCPKDFPPTHFVVIAHGRSGSTMLSLALAGHPNVAMFLELFHRDPTDRKRFFRADECRWNALLQRTIVRRNARVFSESEDPEAFLRSSVFYSRHSKRIRAIGFKLLHNFSVLGAASERLWGYVKSNKTLRVIHLRRRDLVAAFVSHEVARVTGTWTYFKSTKSLTGLLPPFVADVEQFAAFAREIIKGERLMRKMLKGRNVLELTYEQDLGPTFEATSCRLQKFLSVPFSPLPICTVKTPSRELARQIRNLDELRQCEARLTEALARPFLRQSQTKPAGSGWTDPLQ
jgi:LPS sulfotransferase NodH